MKIEIPKDIEKEFLSFLDVSISILEEGKEDRRFGGFTDKEEDCIKFLKDFLKNKDI